MNTPGMSAGMAVLGYLVNSLWEVPVIFAAGWLAARMVRRIGPQPGLEHRVWVGALVLEALLPACRLDLQRIALLLQQVTGALSGHGHGAPAQVTVAMGAGLVSGHGVLRLPATVLAGIVVAYGCSVLYFAGRLGWGLWRTDGMQRQAERVTLDGEAAMCLERYREVFGIGAVSVAISNLLAGPVTVGIFRRMLLVPPGFLENVGAGDLEALVAHEFAHMRRRDFLKNVAYGVLTLPVSFHPALWLTRARVAESREMVCDAMAAAAVAGRERYARSLLRLASMLADRARFANRMQARTLHAIGIFDANIFERRIMNLTERRFEIKGTRRIVAVAACIVLAMATCASALALRMEIGTPVAASEAATGHGQAKVAGGVMAGNILSKVNPTYPQDAKDAKVSGAVVMKAVISKDGKVESLQIVSGPEMLRTSSLDAVRQWTYKPFLLNGQPTDVETTITVNYSLVR